MHKKILLAVVVIMALLLAELPKGWQAKAIDSEPVMEEVRDTMGQSSGFGYRAVNKTILNEKDLGSGRSKMSERSLTEIPRSYDAREEGFVTDIKDQGTLEICWAFAAMGASESDVLQKQWEKEPDLSEYHLSYSAYNKALDPLGLTEEDTMRAKEMSNDIYKWGGNDYLAVSTLSRWQGEVDEDTAPLTDLNQALAEGKTAALPDHIMYAEDRYHLQNAEFVYLTEKNQDIIKQKLMQYGAGVISFHAPETAEEVGKYGNTGRNDFTAYYCDNTSYQSNHAVVVVGWDDDYAVSNFNKNCQPERTGAWLVRNSWGDCNELGGYFWLSYEDAMLQVENNKEAEIVFYDVESADNYDHNYQYDGGMPANYLRGPESIANVYRAQNNEKLEAVSFYTQERNVTYTIDVYKISDASCPTSGIKLGETLTGVLEERGYHTVDFTEAGGRDLFVAKGDQFSIVIRLTDAAGSDVYYTFEAETGYMDMEECVAAGSGESFIYYGNTWKDFAETVGSDGIKRNANFCLKAFASISTDVPQASATPTSTPTVIPTVAVTKTPEDTTTVQETEEPAVSPPCYPMTRPIVKKLKFKPAVKSVRAGKKLKLNRYLKITRNRAGKPKIIYQFTRAKYKKYATLSRKGILKAKKAGRKKTLYVRARAKDGSNKTAKIKIKIK